MENKTIRLTKKVAECSALSRREAALAIKKGEITVNGVVEKNPAAEIQPGDVIARDGQELIKKEKAEYYLFNKPKSMLFSDKSDKKRPSVLEIMAKTSKASLSSVLPIPDFMCGLLLLSNDDSLIISFSHQKKSLRQKYEVVLAGLPDSALLSSLEAKWKEDKSLGILQCSREVKNDNVVLEIEMNHPGVERLVSDLTGHDCVIIKTDRVGLGSMTKKDISRGWYRPLTEKEIIWLKHFN